MKPVPKKKAYRDNKYLDFIRDQPCCLTGKPAEAAHIRNASNGGTSKKPSDTYALPLDHEKHICGEHGQGKDTFWGNIDPYKFCVIYLAKYFKKKLKQDFKRVLLQLLFVYIENELRRDPFDVVLLFYGNWLIQNPSKIYEPPKKEALNLIFHYLDKTENIDPYRLAIELVTDYLRNRQAK